MRGFRVNHVLLSLVLAGFALPVFAQDSPAPSPATERAATFLTSAPGATSDFSGLAVPPALVSPPPAPQVPPPVQTVTQAVDNAPKVEVTSLPDVSPEAIGLENSNNLGAAMWKGTPRIMANRLLSMAVPTRSPMLNDLARRLLVTVASPPEGNDDTALGLMALRVGKLAAFADVSDAWALTQRSDAKLIDDATIHTVAEDALAAKSEGVCDQIPVLAKAHTNDDWQKSLVICQMAAKDTQSAQVALDVMRAQKVPDAIFLQIADKNILGESKVLPTQLTPLSPSLLGALRLANLPLPEGLYRHADYALAIALLGLNAKQDDARLDLGEQLADRGLIDKDQLVGLYKNFVFKPEEVAAPQTSSVTGSRQRVLLYQAALNEKDSKKRIDYALTFSQITTPSMLNGLGFLLSDMLGEIKPEVSFSSNAAAVARLYLLGGKTDAATAWLALARRDPQAASWQGLWPQFVLGGAVSESDYAVDLGKWLDASMANADAQPNSTVARDNVSASLLMFDAAGFSVPDALWTKTLSSPRNAKHVAYSPVLVERLRAAAAANRRAEVVLLAVDVAQDGEIALPVAVDITRALRLVGLKSEAMAFARQSLALLTNTN